MTAVLLVGFIALTGIAAMYLQLRRDVTAHDYKALREQFSAAPRGRKRKYPQDVAEARQKETNRRCRLAESRAFSVLSRLHPDDYRALYLQAKEEVNDEFGPLPGDELDVDA